MVLLRKLLKYIKSIFHIRITFLFAVTEALGNFFSKPGNQRLILPTLVWNDKVFDTSLGDENNFDNI